MFGKRMGSNATAVTNNDDGQMVGNELVKFCNIRQLYDHKSVVVIFF